MIFAFIKLFNLKPCNWKPKSRSASRVRLEWDLLEPQGINPCCPSDVSLLEWWYPPLTFSSIYIQQSYINVPNIPFKLKAFFLLLNKMIRFAKLSAAQCTTSNMNETKIINFFQQMFQRKNEHHRSSRVMQVKKSRILEAAGVTNPLMPPSDLWPWQRGWWWHHYMSLVMMRGWWHHDMSVV